MVVYVPYEKLTLSPYNVRRRVVRDRVIALMKDISRRGLLHPLIVTFNEKKDLYEIVCGRYRYEAIGELRKRDKITYEKYFYKGIPVEVKQLSPREAIITSLTENIMQNTISEDELVNAIRALMIEHNLSINQISDELSIPLEKLDNLMKLHYVKEKVPVSGPGRPSKSEAEEKTSKIALSYSIQLQNMLDRLGLLKPKEKTTFIDEFIEKTKGLPSKQIREIISEVRKSPRDYKKIIDRLTKVRKVNLNILIEEDIAKKLKERAKREKKIIDEVIEEILRKELK